MLRNTGSETKGHLFTEHLLRARPTVWEGGPGEPAWPRPPGGWVGGYRRCMDVSLDGEPGEAGRRVWQAAGGAPGPRPERRLSEGTRWEHGGGRWARLRGCGAWVGAGRAVRGEGGGRAGHGRVDGPTAPGAGNPGRCLPEHAASPAAAPRGDASGTASEEWARALVAALGFGPRTGTPEPCSLGPRLPERAGSGSVRFRGRKRDH